LPVRTRAGDGSTRTDSTGGMLALFSSQCTSLRSARAPPAELSARLDSGRIAAAAPLRGHRQPCGNKVFKGGAKRAVANLSAHAACRGRPHRPGVDDGDVNVVGAQVPRQRGARRVQRRLAHAVAVLPQPQPPPFIFRAWLSAAHPMDRYLPCATAEESRTPCCSQPWPRACQAAQTLDGAYQPACLPASCQALRAGHQSPGGPACGWQGAGHAPARRQCARPRWTPSCCPAARSAHPQRTGQFQPHVEHACTTLCVLSITCRAHSNNSILCAS